jgi:hypothetical protein
LGVLAQAPGYFHRGVRVHFPVAVLERRYALGEPGHQLAVLVVDGEAGVERELVLEADCAAAADEHHPAGRLGGRVDGEANRLGTAAGPRVV